MTAKTMFVRFPAAVCILLILFVGQGLGQETKLTWFGHAAFSITTPSGRAKLAIPHHFGTFPGITENATGFAAELKLRKVAFREMKPGETLTFQGSRIR